MNTFLPFILLKSIGVATANATLKPGSLQPWVDEITAQVQANGKFTQPGAGYRTISPPPFLWDYKCAKCRFWQQLEILGNIVYPGACQVVDGEIARNGWCALWLPSDDRPMFSWVSEFMGGDW